MKDSVIPVSLLALGLVFVITGIALGDMELVFKKAIFICLECIGIG
ncbi:MAG: hypothetical protein LBG07_02855 [Treponema sp.]|jgi:uncharacterized protein YjeT (DUF2065 family)|nr:hypothetical protein [Treponema sp.]